MQGVPLSPMSSQSCHSGADTDSEARPPPGPRNHPPEWKGMGTPHRHCRTSYHNYYQQQQQHHHLRRPYQHQRRVNNNIGILPLPPPPSALRLLCLVAVFCGFALTSVSGLQADRDAPCPVDHCLGQYNSNPNIAGDTGGGVGGAVDLRNINSNNPLTASGAGGGGGITSTSTTDNNSEHEAQCVVLRTQLNCIKSTLKSFRGCRGNMYFHFHRKGINKHMESYNCSVDGPTHHYEVDPAQGDHRRGGGGRAPPPVVPPPHQVPKHCRYNGPQVFRHCGLFGDPHLRTFNNEFQTCKVKGAWPLVNNKYLTVQVTNDAVPGVGGGRGGGGLDDDDVDDGGGEDGEGDATATSKLTVIVKEHPECGSDKFHTYQAQTDSLPSAFEDGNTSIGPHAGVQVVEVDPNRHVEIHVHYIATTIVVRQIGRYFTFAIHTPQKFADSASKRAGELELCSKGCPASEQINYKQYLAQRRDTVTKIQNQGGKGRGAGGKGSKPLVSISRFEAEKICRDSGLVDFYFDSCVFDLMATGDKNFTLAALSALKDVLRLDPAMAPLANRTSLQPYDDAFGGAAALARTVSWGWWHVLVLASAVLTLWQRDVVGVLR